MRVNKRQDFSSEHTVTLLRVESVGGSGGLAVCIYIYTHYTYQTSTAGNRSLCCVHCGARPGGREMPLCQIRGQE